MISFFTEGALYNGLGKSWHDNVLLLSYHPIQEDCCNSNSMEERVPVFPGAKSLGFVSKTVATLRAIAAESM